MNDFITGYLYLARLAKGSLDVGPEVRREYEKGDLRRESERRST